jgi:hypothetical protein
VRKDPVERHAVESPGRVSQGRLVKGSRPDLLAKVILLPFRAIAHHPRHIDAPTGLPDPARWPCARLTLALVLMRRPSSPSLGDLDKRDCGWSSASASCADS